MALTKSEIDILRFIQKKRPAPVTPGEFVNAEEGYDKGHIIAVRLAMNRLASQGWLVQHDTDKRIKSYSISSTCKTVDFNRIDSRIKG